MHIECFLVDHAWKTTSYTTSCSVHVCICNSSSKYSNLIAFNSTKQNKVDYFFMVEIIPHRDRDLISKDFCFINFENEVPFCFIFFLTSVFSFLLPNTWAKPKTYEQPFRLAITLYDETCPEKDFEGFFLARRLEKNKKELFVCFVLTIKVSDWLTNVTRSCDWLIFDNQQLASRVRRTAKGNRSKHRKFWQQNRRRIVWGRLQEF